MKENKLGKLLNESTLFAVIFWLIVGLCGVMILLQFIGFIVNLANNYGFLSAVNSLFNGVLMVVFYGTVSLSITTLCAHTLLRDKGTDEENTTKNDQF